MSILAQNAQILDYDDFFNWLLLACLMGSGSIKAFDNIRLIRRISFGHLTQRTRYFWLFMGTAVALTALGMLVWRFGFSNTLTGLGELYLVSPMFGGAVIIFLVAHVMVLLMAIPAFVLIYRNPVKYGKKVHGAYILTQDIRAHTPEPLGYDKQERAITVY